MATKATPKTSAGGYGGTTPPSRFVGTGGYPESPDGWPRSNQRDSRFRYGNGTKETRSITRPNPNNKFDPDGGLLNKEMRLPYDRYPAPNKKNPAPNKKKK